MDKNPQIGSDGQPADHWARLDACVQANPRDAGCDEAMEMMDVCADLLAAGGDPADRYPGLHAHFMECGPCAQDLEGLLATVIRESHVGNVPRAAPGPHRP